MDLINLLAHVAQVQSPCATWAPLGLATVQLSFKGLQPRTLGCKPLSGGPASTSQPEGMSIETTGGPCFSLRRISSKGARTAPLKEKPNWRASEC